MDKVAEGERRAGRNAVAWVAVLVTTVAAVAVAAPTSAFTPCITENPLSERCLGDDVDDTIGSITCEDVGGIDLWRWRILGDDEPLIEVASWAFRGDCTFWSCDIIVSDGSEFHTSRDAAGYHSTGTFKGIPVLDPYAACGPSDTNGCASASGLVLGLISVYGSCV